jgi:glutamate racemase
MDKIKASVPKGMKIISQSEIIANSLHDYLTRHSEMETRLSKNRGRYFYTTDSSADFDKHATNFYGSAIQSAQIHL